MRRSKRFRGAAAWDDDPMNGLSNLFDTAMVFALGFLLALVASYSIQEMLDPQSTMTMVKNPGDPNMQIIIKDMDKIQVLNMTGKMAGGQGAKIWGPPIVWKTDRWSTCLRTPPHPMIGVSLNSQIVTEKSFVHVVADLDRMSENTISQSSFVACLMPSASTSTVHSPIRCQFSD